MRITDIKATGLYPRQCDHCEMKIEQVVYRITLCDDEEGVSKDLYVCGPCCIELAARYETDPFLESMLRGGG
jgi:hypothetical protein